jgi:hypothetical protein
MDDVVVCVKPGLFQPDHHVSLSASVPESASYLATTL